MIGVGDTLPDGILYHIDEAGILQIRSIRSLFSKKRVVLLGVVGAFSTICSTEDVPAYMSKAHLLKQKGVNHIYCMTVNDPFVVKAWSETYEERDKIMFLADGSATYAQALGLDVDLSHLHMGLRSLRFVLFADNLIVRILSVEDGDKKALKADELLAQFI